MDKYTVIENGDGRAQVDFLDLGIRVTLTTENGGVRIESRSSKPGDSGFEYAELFVRPMAGFADAEAAETARTDVENYGAERFDFPSPYIPGGASFDGAGTIGLERLAAVADANGAGWGPVLDDIGWDEKHVHHREVDGIETWGLVVPEVGDDYEQFMRSESR